MHLAEEFLNYMESEKIYSPGMFKPMTCTVKECFDETAAYQFCNMIYTLAIRNSNIDKEALTLLASVIPDIKKRDLIHQTFTFDKEVQQLNINSEVKNKHEK